MADERIKDLARTVTDPKPAEYIETDHATDGTGKLDLATWLANRANPLSAQTALVLDGALNTPCFSSLGAAGAINADDFTIVGKISIPASGGFRGTALTELCSLGASATNSSAGAPNFRIYAYPGSYSLLATFSNGTGGREYALDFTACAGGVAAFAFKRIGATMYGAVNSAPFASLGAGSTFGTSPPDSSLSITTSYLLVGAVSAAYPWIGRIFSLGGYTYGLSDAQWHATRRNGCKPLPEDEWGSQANQFTGDSSTFTSGVGDWAGADGGSISASGGLGLVSCPSYINGIVTNAIQTTNRAILRFRATLSSLVGGANLGFLYGNGVSIGTLVSGSNEIVFTAAFTTTLKIWNGGGAISFSIDNVSLVRLGAFFYFDGDDLNASRQWPDRSTNLAHLLLATTGNAVSGQTNGTFQVRLKSDGTTSAQQLGGGTMLPANCQQLRWRARSQSGTPSIILGSSSGGSQFVASVALSTTWKDLTLALTGGIVTAATPIWMTASAANVVEVQLTAETLSA